MTSATHFGDSGQFRNLIEPLPEVMGFWILYCVIEAMQTAAFIVTAQ
jgi:hypothetical protein